VDHLIEGDVLLVGKGNANHAAVWPGGQEDTLASNTLFVIRPDPEQLLPSYLAGYLNSSTAQAWFATHRKTGTVHVLGRAALDQLPVPLPPIDVQRQMVKLSVATGQMIDVYNELAQAHSTLLNSAWAQLNQP
jgi:type I restriction enzyme M protein